MSDVPEATKAATSMLPVDDAMEFACDVARIAAVHKTEDIAVLDLRGLSGLTDFFVIGTGTSDRQMGAVLDHIAAHAKACDRRAFNVANTRETTWVLADYVDVVIHLFDAEHREYYDLDGLWGDAPRVAWHEAESDQEDAPRG
jgi:ribosome-associated protein